MRSLCRHRRVGRRDSRTLPWGIATCRGQAGEEPEPEAKKVRQKDIKETAMQCVAFEGRVCPEAKGGQLHDVESQVKLRNEILIGCSSMEAIGPLSMNSLCGAGLVETTLE